VYRVYTDGRPDELVRGVDLIGTPLSMFSRIRAGGGEYEIFSGFCGAESGAVPVTAVSPEIFVSQIELQKKGHAQSKLPLLPRPDVRKEKR
jgi:predicted Zn-dependent protease